MKDNHTYGKKMARKGRTKVIYKGTFVSIQTLNEIKSMRILQLKLQLGTFRVQRMMNLDRLG